MRDDTYATLAALEFDWANAWLNHNEAICEYLLADDFVEIAATGQVASKGEWLAALESHAPRLVTWSDMRVRPFGRFAIVHGKLQFVGDQCGAHRSYLATDIWACRGSEWRVVSRQLTKAHAA